MGTLASPVSPVAASTQSSELGMAFAAYLLVLLAGVATAHEYFPEKCPSFTPMQGFDWDQFANGVWYVTQKFATRSTCLTYEFTTDELGFKEITQLRQLPYSEKVGPGPRVQVHRQAVCCQRSSPCKDECPLSPQPNRSGELCGVGHGLHKLWPHLHLTGDRPL